MDPSGMMNEGALFNMTEIWQFPMTRDFSVNPTTATVAGDQARIGHALSQAMLEGLSFAWNRRDDESGKVVSTRNKRQKIDEVCDGKRETGWSETNMDQKKQKNEPMKDYIHVRARRGKKRKDKRMRILQDLVPGCNKIIGKALVLDEIINYMQSLQRQVEFLSMKLEAVNTRMNHHGVELFQTKELGQQEFEDQEMQFGLQSRREFSREASSEWLHMCR